MLRPRRLPRAKVGLLLALLAVAVVALGTDSRSVHAHGTPLGYTWQWPLDNGTRVQWRGSTQTSEPSDEIAVLAMLWSGTLNGSRRLDAFVADTDLFEDKYVEATATWFVDRGRCYLAYSGHSYVDHHWRAWPPPFVYAHEGHWRTGALLRQLICRR